MPYKQIVFFTLIITTAGHIYTMNHPIMAQQANKPCHINSELQDALQKIKKTEQYHLMIFKNAIKRIMHECDQNDQFKEVIKEDGMNKIITESINICAQNPLTPQDAQKIHQAIYQELRNPELNDFKKKLNQALFKHMVNSPNENFKKYVLEYYTNKPLKRTKQRDDDHLFFAAVPLLCFCENNGYIPPFTIDHPFLNQVAAKIESWGVKLKEPGQKDSMGSFIIIEDYNGNQDNDNQDDDLLKSFVIIDAQNP